jgi:hypothetical protein
MGPPDCESSSPGSTGLRDDVRIGVDPDGPLGATGDGSVATFVVVRRWRLLAPWRLAFWWWRLTCFVSRCLVLRCPAPFAAELAEGAPELAEGARRLRRMALP